ncbi:hypothetical protein [Olsenella urininfantis]|uniref:hypothetical protein n=1 Tax=Olsenella urininfantis TaxID=1871033 RepID=UPI000984AA53|nr:hypothetical protein [Olsenella urininfantis]
MYGSIFGEFENVRTVNVNLRTGEVYSFDDVLHMTDGIANQFVSTLARSSGDFTPSIFGRERIVAMLRGEDEQSWRVRPSVFVDGNGRVNVGVTFWFGKEGVGVPRGWWDITLTDGQLAEAHRDSSFWGLF